MYLDQIKVNINYFIYIDFLHKYLYKYMLMFIFMNIIYNGINQNQGKKMIK